MNSFAYKWFRTKTRFDIEAKSQSEMTYWPIQKTSRETLYSTRVSPAIRSSNFVCRLLSVRVSRAASLNKVKNLSVSTDKTLRWLKTVSSTSQGVDFDGSLLPLFIRMLQSWYQKTA